jgi:hypothetical protein
MLLVGVPRRVHRAHLWARSREQVFLFENKWPKAGAKHVARISKCKSNVGESVFGPTPVALRRCIHPPAFTSYVLLLQSSVKHTAKYTFIEVSNIDHR